MVVDVWKMFFHRIFLRRDFIGLSARHSVRSTVQIMRHHKKEVACAMMIWKRGDASNHDLPQSEDTLINFVLETHLRCLFPFLLIFFLATF